MKRKSFFVMIFMLGLLLSDIIPVSAQTTSRDYYFGSFLNVGLERFGHDWRLATVGIIGKRAGFGFTAVEVYKPYKFPKSSSLDPSAIPFPNQWLNGPFETESSEILDFTNYGKFFPLSFYLRVLTWGKDKNKRLISPSGGILLYVDDSFWNRIFKKPTIDYSNEKLPTPSFSNTEIGIRIIPFGGVASLSLTLFYKSMSISPGVVAVCKDSGYTVGNIHYIGSGGCDFYYFPGYKKDFFGFGIEIMLIGGLFPDQF